MFSTFLQLLSNNFFYSITAIALFLNILSPSALAQTRNNQTIKGTTGGKNNSGDCGYIADRPNHVINLREQTYSLNVILEANKGKPSLLILGPSTSDRFCVLGEPSTGKKAKMGGVWAPGKYLIYVGDAQGNKNPFTLRITSK